MRNYSVIERLPDGRERTLGSALSLDAAVELIGTVRWAGTIREEPPPCRYCGDTERMLGAFGQPDVPYCATCGEVPSPETSTLGRESYEVSVRKDREASEIAQRGRRPGVFDLRRQLGRAPTAEEYREAGN